MNSQTGSLNKLLNLGVTTKLVCMLLAFAAVPMAIIGYVVETSFNDIKEQAATRFQDSAVTIADKIDRNLFERYGDVQAFGLNRITANRDSWYKDSNNNKITAAMNQYVQTYGIYYLTIMVDTEGKVIAVNNKNASGESLNTSGIFNKNFSNTAWFRALKSQQYTTRMPFTAPGNDISSGTFIEDLHIDNDVKSTYPGDDGMVLGFSSPVYDNGKLIGFWSNRTKFSLVEEIIQQAYRELKANGYAGSEITLLDSVGKIIVDYDPKTKGSESVVHDLENVVMKFNLASKNVEAAVKAVNGESGRMYAFHARKKINQAAGYAHLKGALGFPGMNWSVLVRVPEEEAAPWLLAIENKLMMIIILCVVVCSIFGLFVGKRVVLVLQNIVTAAKSAADGDLTSRIDVKSKDEFGELSRAFNNMMERISAVVADVSTGSDMIKSAAREVARGSMDLSQRTEEQASSLEETASSMEEMTSSVKQNADNAAQADQLAQNARQEAEKGGEVVSQAVNAMSEINESSNKIAEIISVVEEIAFQTNLLALNAAVEAARAGEQGRGFAVVATEVRSLAGRSSDASKDIKSLIEASVKKVKIGSELVNKSGQTLDEIVTGVKKVSDIVAEISASSQEQASGVEQVNKAVVGMDEMTQQNAALVEESASASKSMEDQAIELGRLMEYFKLDDQSSLFENTKATMHKPENERRKPGRPFHESHSEPGSSKTTRSESNVEPAPEKMKTGTGDSWDEF